MLLCSGAVWRRPIQCCCLREKALGIREQGSPTQHSPCVGARVTRPAAAIAAQTGHRNPAPQRSNVDATIKHGCRYHPGRKASGIIVTVGGVVTGIDADHIEAAFDFPDLLSD